MVLVNARFGLLNASFRLNPSVFSKSFAEVRYCSRLANVEVPLRKSAESSIEKNCMESYESAGLSGEELDLKQERRIAKEARLDKMLLEIAQVKKSISKGKAMSITALYLYYPVSGSCLRNLRCHY